jgi:hypothetical protein
MNFNWAHMQHWQLIVPDSRYISPQGYSGPARYGHEQGVTAVMGVFEVLRTLTDDDDACEAALFSRVRIVG